MPLPHDRDRLVAQDRATDALCPRPAGRPRPRPPSPRRRPGGRAGLQADRRRLALQLLEDSWRAEPHPDVARAYAQVDPSETASQRQKRIDCRLAPLNRNHAETLVLQAEVAMQAGDWSTARAAASRRPSMPARRHGSIACWPSWSASRAATASRRRSGSPGPPTPTPDRAWVCDDTGEVLPSWRPVAPSGRFDAVHWATPPKVATLLGAEQTTYIQPHDDASTASAPQRRSGRERLR